MKRGNWLALVITMVLLGSRPGFSQVANFTAPATACISQRIPLQNNSTASAAYTWDFCQDGLLHAPVHTDVTTIGGTNIPVGLELAYDKGSWFGFACSRDGGSQLTRLDFGNNLTNAPAIVDLSATISSFGGSSDITLLREAGNWYGFVIDYNTNVMTRLDFGNSLSNTPVAAPFGHLGGAPWDGLYGITVVKQGSDFFGFVTCTFSSVISVLQFGSSITNTPVVTHLSNSLLINPVKIEIVKQSNFWYGVVTSLNLANQSQSTVLLLNFGPDLSTVPVMTVAASVPGAAGMQMAKDGNAFFGFIFGAAGNASRLDFGSSVAAVPAITDLGHLGSTNVVYGFSLLKDGPNWRGLYIEVFSEKVHMLTFTDQCTDVSPLTSSTVNPVIHYTTSGSKRIELLAYTAAGAVDTISHSISIQNLLSPDVNIISQNECMGAPVLFSENLVSGPPIVSSNWNFGDGQTDTQATTSNIYSSTGMYLVTLNVTAGNGCANNTSKAIQIYNAPVSQFSLPTNTPLCTNQLFTFTNSSTSDAGSSPSWQWLINGSPVSVAKDLAYAFNTTSLQTIKLRASLPGCFNENTQTINSLLAGPDVNFTASNGCEGDAVQFANGTTDQVTGFLWDFGDSETSTNQNAAHSFSSPGVFSVTLTGSSVNGCQNSTTKPVTIHSKPHTDFTIDLPPFSCSGSPSQFNDATPNPADSNLDSWTWSFGDAAGGTSVQRNPLYTYPLAGPYIVGLSVTTNFGCEASVQKTIAITPSPTVSFTHTPACANEGTQFTDASGGTVKSWLWKIDNSSYTFNNPLHVFSGAGTYNAQLTVTDNNHCVAQTTRSINVPVAQFPDFSVQYPCAGQPTVFQDGTPGTTDPIVSYGWNFSGQGTGSGASAQFTFPATGNFSVTMEVRAQSGCTYDVTKTVSIVRAPLAAFIASPEAGAVPLHVQFTNTSTNASNYLWRFHDESHATSQTVSPSFAFNALGEYVVDLQATNQEGCVDTFSKIISAVVPRVDAGLSGLQFVKDPATGEWQALFVLTNEGNLPLVNPAIFTLISGTVTIKETLQLTLLPGKSVAQLLKYSILPGALDYLCLSVDTNQDANPNNNKQCAAFASEAILFEPYPNPVSGDLHMDWIGTTTGVAHFMVFSGTGAKAFDKSIEAPSTGLNEVTLDVSNWSPGMYILVVSYGGQKKSFRFVVQ